MSDLTEWLNKREESVRETEELLSEVFKQNLDEGYDNPVLECDEWRKLRIDFIKAEGELYLAEANLREKLLNFRDKKISFMAQSEYIKKRVRD